MAPAARPLGSICHSFDAAFLVHAIRSFIALSLQNDLADRAGEPAAWEGSL